MSTENPRGKGSADESSTADDKDVWECPTCNRDGFKNQRGVRIHHQQVHGESIAWEVVECEWCGCEVEIRSSELKTRNNVYCSTECQHNGYKSEKVEVECEWCGGVEMVIPSRKSTHRFCSTECMSNYQSEVWQGENGPNYRGRIKKTCEYCSDIFHVRPSREHRMFCGMSCKDDWWSENCRGDDHPNWKGGWTEYYGPNWLKQRRKAVIRDQGRCQVCGATPVDIGHDISVHHLTPIREYKQEYDAPEWYEKANRLDNLVCYCRSCHGKWEGIPLRPH